MITNADQGILLTWTWYPLSQPEGQMAVTTGTGVSLVSGPAVPGQGDVVEPVLQAQDGTFIGTVPMADSTTNMIAFDASGNLLWSVAGSYTPQIATADGGVIAVSGDTGAAVTFDQSGNATGQMASLLVQSWLGNTYQTGSVEQISVNALLFALSFWPFEGGNASGNYTAQIPIDSITNNRVKNILTQTRWRTFAGSNCAVVFGNAGSGIASNVAGYSLATAQAKQGLTNFYDIGNAGVGSLTRRQVTGGQIANDQTLADHLLGATAITDNMGYGKQTAVVTKSGFFSQDHPQFTLMHEVLLHAYGNWWDDPIFANTFFTQNGLWRPDGSTATTYISTWMSTDCTCTPGKLGTTCSANTASW
jgi:hypothetical protein